MRRERKQYNKRERKPNTPINTSTLTTTPTSAAAAAALPIIDNTTILNKSAIKLQQQVVAATTSLDDELKHQYLDIIEKLMLNEVNIEAKLEQELELNGLLKRIIHMTTMQSNPMNSQQHPQQQQQLKQLIIDYVGKECIVLIRWAKTIHNYQTLNLNDQAHLIESNFMEILLLNFIWRTCIYNHYDLNMIYFHKQFKLNRYSCKELNLMNIFDSIIQLCKNFIQLRVNIKEYLCLKTIILLKSGNYCLFLGFDLPFLNLFSLDYGCVEVQRVVELREQCLNALETAIDLTKIDFEKCSQQGGTSSAYWKTNRLSNLLLILAEIKSLSLRFIHYILYIHSLHQIDLPDLLVDMFDAMRVLGLVTTDFNRHDSIDSNASSTSSTSSRVTALNVFTSSSRNNDTQMIYEEEILYQPKQQQQSTIIMSNPSSSASSSSSSSSDAAMLDNNNDDISDKDSLEQKFHEPFVLPPKLTTT